MSAESAKLEEIDAPYMSTKSTNPEKNRITTYECKSTNSEKIEAPHMSAKRTNLEEI